MSNNKKRLTAAAHVWANEWQHLEGRQLLETVINGPLAGRVAVSSSFGAESAVLLDMVAGIDRTIPVIFIDTGRLFAETLGYRDRLTAHLGLRDVRTVKADEKSINDADPNGDLYLSNPDACCNVRKVIPNASEVSGFDVIITGRKSFHGGERSNLLTAERSGWQIKLNPLAHWSQTRIEETFLLRQLPRHPLVDSGYRSIGCSTCTHKAAAKAGVRAGRWCGQQKTECGIHTIALA